MLIGIFKVEINIVLYFFRVFLKEHMFVYRHLPALAVVLDVHVLVIRPLAFFVARIAEAARLINLAVAAESFVVVCANLAPGIDLRIAWLDAHAIRSPIFAQLCTCEITLQNSCFSNDPYRFQYILLYKQNIVQYEKKTKRWV